MSALKYQRVGHVLSTNLTPRHRGLVNRPVRLADYWILDRADRTRIAKRRAEPKSGTKIETKPVSAT